MMRRNTPKENVEMQMVDQAILQLTCKSRQ